MAAIRACVAIVTGSGQGIGRSIALRLADDGLDVVINDLPRKAHTVGRVVEEVRAKGRRSIGICADVSLEEEVRGMVEKTVEELGQLDVMVANAAIHLGIKSALEITQEEWDRVHAVNARGPFLQYKHAAIQMIKQGRGGRIIGACSAAGKKGLPNLAGYGAAKYAVRGLTQSLAHELAKHQITVNAYAPGLIVTEMSGLEKEDGTTGDGLNFEDCGLPKTSTPIGQPRDIASMVSYLVKPEAYFITGQTISVDGGMVMD